ncbi:MAG: SDR family oxidoreductase [Rickettsiales bacterium]|jgi:3-oxoacyl-[acyl-carrier protein] reductase|nr:SDR family oxidoreductase [Rickettsiales bacterium]
MKDKVVLVTGGSRGIGYATAQEFIALGAKVIILHSNPFVKTDLKVAKEIIVDISDEKAVKNAVDAVIAEFGKIDVLVNNAGMAIDKEFYERSVEDWRRTLDVNLIGMFAMSKYVGEIMVKNKFGKIVNVSSTSGINDFSPYAIDYNASKAAIISLTKSLAIEFSPYVNVNAIAPGWVNTDMNKDLSVDYLAEEAEKVCLKRISQPSEMAKIIKFLASDDASYVNGTVIIADGGRL